MAIESRQRGIASKYLLAMKMADNRTQLRRTETAVNVPNIRCTRRDVDEAATAEETKHKTRALLA